MADVNLRTAPMYMLVSPPIEAQVRSLRFYALIQPPPQVNVRSVRTYAVVRKPPYASLKMEGAAAILAQINKEHSKALTLDQVSLGNPSAGGATDEYNSKVTLTAKASWLYYGDMTIRYDRFPLELAVGGPAVPGPGDTATTIHGRLARINQIYGCNLKPRDIVDGPVAADATSYKLVAASTSYLFTPGTEVLMAGGMLVDPSSFITYQALASLVGLTAGDPINETAPWMQLALNGKLCYIPQQACRTNLSWEQLNNAGLVTGKVVSIGGKNFTVRLMTGANADPGSTAGGEWDQLMYSVAAARPASYTGPVMANFTEAQLGFDSAVTPTGRANFTKETHSSNSTYCTERGLNGTAFGVKEFSYTTKSAISTNFGWRPILVEQ